LINQEEHESFRYSRIWRNLVAKILP